MRSLLLAVLLFAQAPNPAQVQTGTVTGRLLGLNGAPAVGVRVSASPAADPSKPTTAASGEVPFLTALTQTDAAGRYRLENLPAGRYYILAGFVDFPTYYPGAVTTASATSVAVAARATVTGIDFQAARSSTGLTISGRLKRDSNEGVGGMTIAFSGGDQYLNARSRSDGTFEFSKLRPGEYSISVSSPNFAPQQVSLSDKDISGLEFIVPWTVDITGTVVVEGGGVRPNLNLTFAGGPRAIIATNARDTIRTTLPEGPYVVTASGLPSGFYIKSIKSGSMDLLTETLNVSRTAAPSPITVTLGVSTPAPWIKLSGRVTGLPNPRTAETRIALNGQQGDATDTVIGADGSFEFPKLLPGTYSVNIRPNSNPFPPLSVIVPNSDISDVLISIPAGKEITGRISVEGGGPIPYTGLTLNGTFGPLLANAGPPTRAQLLVGAQQSRNVMNVNANLQQDGSFKAVLPEGQYRVTATPQNRDSSGMSLYTVRAFTYGSIDLTKDPILVTIADSSNLNLTFAAASPSSWSKVSGNVTGLDSAFLIATPLTVTLSGNGLLTNWSAQVKPDGSFEFPKVYSGNYSARIIQPVANPATSGAIRFNFNAASTTVNVAGTDVTKLVIAVPRQKEISGRVTLDGRGLVPRINIALAPPASNSNFATSFLNINPLPDGTFKVVIEEGERRVNEAIDLPQGYVLKSLTYGTIDVLKNPLKIAASDTAELNVTISTPNLTPVSVSGRLNGVDDAARARGPVNASLVASGNVVSLPLNAPVGADGTFQFPEVFPGNYTLRATVPGLLSFPTLPVVVANTSVRNLELDIPRQKEITGRVILEGRGAIPRFQISLPLSVPTGSVISTPMTLITPQTDGTFKTTLLVGDHQVGPITGLPLGYSVRSITYGGIEVLKNSLKIGSSGAEEIRITLATPDVSPIRLRGRVSGLDDSVLARGPVTITMTSTSYAASLNMPVRSDGTFEFAEVFRGNYLARVNAPGVINSPPFPVTVADTDIPLFEIALPHQREITGRIVLDGSGPMIRMGISILSNASATGMAAGPADPTTGIPGGLAQNPTAATASAININPQPDGSFRQTVLEGDYRVTGSLGLPPGYTLKTLNYGGTDVLKNPLKIGGSTSEVLLITLTAPNIRPTRLRGRVSGLDDSVFTRGSVNLIMTSTNYIAAFNIPISADGTFEYTDVFPGNYQARVNGPGIQNSPAINVTVATADTQIVDIALPRQKEFTGLVVLEGSGPMPRMGLPLTPVSGNPLTGTSQVNIPGNSPVLLLNQATGTTSTPAISPQPDGSFRLTVPEGEFRVGNVIGLPTGYSLKSLTYGSTDILKEFLKVSRSDTSEMRITVTTSNANSVRVTGRVVGLNDVSRARGPVNVTMNSVVYPAILNSAVNADGTFEFPSVFPATYTLRAVGAGVLNSPNISVTVANSEVRNIEIPIPILREIAGHFLLEGDGPLPAFGLRITGFTTAAAAAGFSGAYPAIRPGTDGSFRASLPEGESRLDSLIGLPPGYTVKSMTYGSTDLLRNPLKVAAGDTAELQITIVSSAKPVRVSGRLEGVDRSRLAQNIARMTLTSGSFVLPLTADIRADGTFEFPKVYPGAYRIIPPSLSPQAPAPVTMPLAIGDKDVTGLVITIP